MNLIPYYEAILAKCEAELKIIDLDSAQAETIKKGISRVLCAEMDLESAKKEQSKLDKLNTIEKAWKKVQNSALDVSECGCSGCLANRIRVMDKFVRTLEEVLGPQLASN